MASLTVLLIILACGAYQYFKGTILKAFATIIIAICASIVAFGFFEQLAELFISKGSNSRYPALVPWAQPLCFALLFILTFSILQTLAMQLTKQPVDFGFIPECIGRALCGVLLGLILSGILLTTLAMMPLPNKYPYPRFDQRSPNATRPTKVLLNADSFAAGWFSLLSGGSLRPITKPSSFAALHPDFLDQLFLNRHNDSGDIPLVTSSQSIDVLKKNGAWHAPEGIKDTDGKPITLKSGHTLTIVRVGIKRSAVKDAGRFTLGQIRLICKQKGFAKGPLTGKAKNVYPIGYLSTLNQVKKKKLAEQITVERTHFDSQATKRYIDFAFYVPNDYTPVLLQFKLNNIAEVPEPVSAEQAPDPVPFVERLKSSDDTTRPSDQRGFPPPDRSRSPSRKRPLSDTSRSIIGDEFD